MTISTTKFKIYSKIHTGLFDNPYGYANMWPIIEIVSIENIGRLNLSDIRWDIFNAVGSEYD